MGWHVAKNHFRRTGGTAIDNHGAYVFRLTDNLFDADPFEDDWGIDESGDVTFAASWTRWAYFARNRYSNSQRRCVELNYWNPQPGDPRWSSRAARSSCRS
jgi:hypothetical protein